MRMPSADYEPNIQVVYTEVEADSDAKFFGNRERIRVGVLDSGKLAASLTALCRQMDVVFSQVESSAGQFEMSSFTLSVEFTAGGQIRLVGSLSTEIKGGATLTFMRKQPSSS